MLASQTVWAQAQVSNTGSQWVLENPHIKLTFDAEKGKLSVLDKQANYLYQQPPEPATPPTPTVPIPKAKAAINVDGDLGEWTAPPVAVLTYNMTPDGNWRNVKDNRDCSATLYAVWDEKNLYLAAKILDEKLVWGETGRQRWWERDSAEFWVGGRQIGLNLRPDGSQARTATTPIDGGVQIALVPSAEGYIMEASFPWSLFPDAPPRTVGAKMRFAFGVNDADDSGEREGQIYFPATWVHSRPETFAEAILTDASGAVPQEAMKKKAEPPRVRKVASLSAPAKGISYETDTTGPKGVKLPVTVKLSLADNAPDMHIEFDMPDRETEINDFSVMEPLVLDSPDAYCAVADYSNGHIYPLNDPKMPRMSMGTDRMDMPWTGILDLAKGFGYILIIDTSDDGGLRMKRCGTGQKTILAPQIFWRPSMGKFRYPRKLLYHFSPSGGYVALAKYYRQYAKGLGLIVPFTEKIKKNPNLERLFGAPDIWGGGGLRFCREAKAAGVDRMIYNGRPSPEDMKAINDLGYLTSEYDNYTDILQVEPGKEVSSNRAHLPDDVVKNKDGSEMKAWLTYDKKTQYMKRCPNLWVPTARIVIKKVLEKYPFVGRFIDVTTAEGLYECYDPKHPLTRTQKRECGVALLSLVREHGLVVGGEHGIWWAVPVQDYIEGMMSGGYAAWPAGHLILPKKMEELTQPEWKVRTSTWEEYQKWGIGHVYRVPLWELVFHDCIVSTWYWGDATDWLLKVQPENADKKDAFNILYGTVPLMWSGPPGVPFKEHKEQFVRSYRNTCKLHEVIAMDEMLSHEFVTPDHAVQRTRFSSGTEVTVNFGEKPYALTFEGKTYELPTNGFFVHGPKVTQYKAIVDGKLTTYIQTPGYLFADGHGQSVDTGAVAAQGPVTLRIQSPHIMRIIAGDAQGSIVIRPRRFVPDWDVGTTRIYSLDDKGRRAQAVDLEIEGEELRLKADGWGGAEALCAAASKHPDIVVDANSMKPSTPTPTQGETVTIEARVRNIGFAAATAKISAMVDEVVPTNEIFSTEVSLGPGSTETAQINVDTKWLDGVRRIILLATPKGQVTEISDQNNQAECELNVSADPSLWPHKVMATVSSGDLPRKNYPVTQEIDLAELAKRVGAPQSANPKTIRVFECDAEGKPCRSIPAQFDLFHDTRGELCWMLTGETAPNTVRRFAILFDTDPNSKLLPPCGTATLGSPIWQKEKNTISTPAYSAVFDDGVIVALYDKLGATPDKSLVTMILLSSKATGWGREEGTLDDFTVRYRGPVRTVITVKKTLATEYVYEKTYTFYPAWFEVATTINKEVGGLYSRVYYALDGQFEDDKGNKALIDGKGEGENIYGKNRNGQWYCVYTPEWAHSCIALTPMGTIAYWDGGAKGGVGFHAPFTKDRPSKVAYVLHPGRKDATFAKNDYAQLTQRPVVKLE